jgi:hypothetical protein
VDTNKEKGIRFLGGHYVFIFLMLCASTKVLFGGIYARESLNFSPSNYPYLKHLELSLNLMFALSFSIVYLLEFFDLIENKK